MIVGLVKGSTAIESGVIFKAAKLCVCPHQFVEFGIILDNQHSAIPIVHFNCSRSDASRVLYRQPEAYVNWQKPPIDQVWRAIEIYLGFAYPGDAPPSSVKARLETLRSTPVHAFYECKSMERDSMTSPRKYSLRLGNRFYPHMKLVIEPTPDNAACMYRADTHDKHIRPGPNSPELPAFLKLMEENQKLS